jgi:hypothetical protein
MDNLVIAKHYPGLPPKQFKAKRAVGFYACLHHSYGPRCPELLRVKLDIKGDIYVLPYEEYGSLEKEFHISHHASGEFHWVEGGEHIHPLYGENDFVASFVLWLKLRFPPCMCVRKGTKLNKEDVACLMKCLKHYVPMINDLVEASQTLYDAGFYSIRCSV